MQAAAAEYRLTENHPLRIDHAAGRRIECLDGTAWITAYGEETDFMLRAGQSFEVPNDGLMLIDAAGAGLVRVRMTASPATVSRKSGWRAMPHKMAAALARLAL